MLVDCVANGVGNLKTADNGVKEDRVRHHSVENQEQLSEGAIFVRIGQLPFRRDLAALGNHSRERSYTLDNDKSATDRKWRPILLSSYRRGPKNQKEAEWDAKRIATRTHPTNTPCERKMIGASFFGKLAFPLRRHIKNWVPSDIFGYWLPWKRHMKLGLIGTTPVPQFPFAYKNCSAPLRIRRPRGCTTPNLCHGTIDGCTRCPI